nr:hypothetical protein [Tanacetum cinerariifolium]
ITSSGWLFIFAIPGHVAHLVESITLDSARSCGMQGEVSNIPMVLSWGGGISPDGFLPSIMLLVVIIAAVVIVAVIVIVVVVGEGLEAVTFPSIPWGNPPIKTSIIFSEFGTIEGHKTANFWNLLT